MNQEPSKLALLYDDAVFKMVPFFRALGYVVIGAIIGAAGMLVATHYQATPQPVKVVETDQPITTPALDLALDKLRTTLETHFIRQEALLTKMQQADVKLGTVNKALTAQISQREPIKEDDATIRAMAKELGVMKMVVK
jgi:hypothetical protein